MRRRLSIVVPTYHRPDLLARCLDAIAGQTLDPASFEVIIADDAATEATRKQIEAYSLAQRASEDNVVRYVPVTGNHGPAAARNIGWRAARSDIIAFTDDDTIPDPGWAAAGLGAFDRDPELAAATGRTDVPLPPRSTDYERNEAGLATAEFITANCFIRKDVLESVGGFDERFRRAWREDSDLQFTLLECGAKIVKVPEAVVVHPLRPAPWGVCLRMQRKSRYEALLFKKHPRLYRRKIGRFAPPSYYAIAACLAAGIVLAILGSLSGLFLALGMWIILTTWLALRRLRGNSWRPTHLAEMFVTSAVIPILSLFWRVEGGVRFRAFFL